MIQIENFLLIIGNARSGSTILGAVLDAHPNMVVANETIESCHLWRGLDGGKILAGVFKTPNSKPWNQLAPPPAAKSPRGRRPKNRTFA
jgi:hypothetical protein